MGTGSKCWCSAKLWSHDSRILQTHATVTKCLKRGYMTTGWRDCQNFESRSQILPSRPFGTSNSHQTICHTLRATYIVSFFFSFSVLLRRIFQSKISLNNFTEEENLQKSSSLAGDTCKNITHKMLSKAGGYCLFKI